MRQVLLVMGIIVGVLFLVGCGVVEQKAESFGSESAQELPVASDEVKDELDQEEEEVILEESEGLKGDLECSVSEECPFGEKCINGVCSTVASLYKTEGCLEKCNFNAIVASTSNGDSGTYSRGQGSYTAAGAVEWKLVSGPDYCSGDEIIVPIELIKKNMGKVISKEVLTLSPGESTEQITHPTIKSVDFTINVESVVEECG